MPSIAGSRVAPSSSTPPMSRLRSGRRAIAGMNIAPRTISAHPIGMLTRRSSPRPIGDKQAAEYQFDDAADREDAGEHPDGAVTVLPKISVTIPVADGMNALLPMAWIARSTISR